MEAKHCPTCGEVASSADTHVCARPGMTATRRARREITIPDEASLPGPKPGDVLDARYEILERVAEGGGGIVFRAHDRKLDVQVALKVLSPSVVSPSMLERFKREIRMTRDIDHPSVSRVFDLGESDGHTFLTMRWIDGETLSKVVRKNGPLSTSRLHRLAACLIDALAAAHRRGIVHRDVKPGNVLVSADGDAVLVDFGIAIDVSRSPDATPHSGDRLTPVDGIVPGTPDYMSPEQSRGEPTPPATDLWSLALTLSFAATGRTGAPERPAEALGRLVRPLRAQIVRCLDADPRRRPKDCVEIQDSLASAVRRRRAVRVWIGAAALIAVAGGAVVWARAHGPKPLPLVHVEPLVNATGDPDLDWLRYGVADLVRAGLESSGGVRAPLDDRAVGESWRIGGRVAREGDRPVVSLVLRSPEGVVRRRARIDPRGASLLRDVARTVSRYEADLGVPRRRAGPARPPPALATDPEAFRFLARARDLVREHKYGEALLDLRRAIARDPEFALAHLEAFVAMSYGTIGAAAEQNAALERARAYRDRLPPSERELVDAVIAARRGDPDRLRTFVDSHRPDSVVYGLAYRAYLPGDDLRRTFLEAWAARLPEDGEPHNQLGYLYWRRYADVARAEVEFKRYIALSPRLANGHDSYCEFLRGQGRIDEAMAECERAIALDPEFWDAHVGIAQTRLLRDDVAGADATLEAMRGRVPPGTLQFLLWSTDWLGTALLAGDRALEQQRLEGIVSDPRVGSFAYVALEYDAVSKALAGDVEGAREAVSHAETGHRLYHGARAGGMPLLRPYVEGLLAYRRADVAAMESAVATLEGLRERNPTMAPAGIDCVELLRALLPAVHGDPSGAASRLEAIGPERSGPRFLAPLERGRVLVAAGRALEARDAYDEAIRRGNELLTTAEVASQWRACLGEAAELARRFGDAAAAARLEGRLASLTIAR